MNRPVPERGIATTVGTRSDSDVWSGEWTSRGDLRPSWILPAGVPSVKGLLLAQPRRLLDTLHALLAPRSAQVPRRDLVSTRLEQALERSGCAICRLAREQEESYLYHFAWESVNDPEVRAKLRASFGFCARHSWALHDLERDWWGDGLEIALVLDDAFQDVAARLREIRPGRHTALLQPRGTCPACEVRQHAVTTYLFWLGRHLVRPDFRALYVCNGGVCIPHLRECLSLAPDPAAFLADVGLHALNEASNAPDLANVLFGWGLVDSSRADRPVATAHTDDLVAGSPCPACAWRLRNDPAAVLEALPRPGGDAPTRRSSTPDVDAALCRRHGATLARLLDVADSRDAARTALANHERAARAVLLAIRDGEVPARHDRERLVSRWLGGFGRAPTHEDRSSACPACLRLSRFEADLLRDLLCRTPARASPRPRFGDAVVCLPHLRILLSAATGEQAAALARNVVSHLEFLGGELRDFIRKHRWDCRDEPRGPEQTSWIRATRWAAGERDAW